MSFENIIYQKADRVAWITINRPPYNVINLKTIREMNEAVRDAMEDAESKVIVINSAGDKAFSTGVDVKDHAPETMDEMLATFDTLCYRLISGAKPTVAVVKGMALGGGCEVAIACDMVIASEKAQIGQPEIKVGVYPSAAAALLPRLISWKKSLELLLTGDSISAEEARQIGLVNVVAPEDQLDEAVRRFLGRLTDKSLVVLQCAKKAYLRALDLPLKEALDAVEDDYKNSLMKTEDALEGINAFMERRKPVWKDR
ncbi:MAG: enoyl-CoA hydratase/isomerase family protein [Chloroflexi bacterium]|nr:enoyl-CoA hydratase/isomerase family protein [Chloroflexota bacterium]